MNLLCEPYTEQTLRVPDEGRHILAHVDGDHIVVYQAYRPEPARYALKHGHFGGPHFSYRRMSWIKTSFSWMMYRSGWATKVGQECVLAVKLRRKFFEQVLAQAVLTEFDESAYPCLADYQAAFRAAEVRLQWDPDRTPDGSRCGGRRAIQLGLSGSVLEEYGQRQVVKVLDMTPFIEDQRTYAQLPPFDKVQVPIQRVYWPANPKTRARIGLSESASHLSEESA